jgi:hypothetical protein
VENEHLSWRTTSSETTPVTVEQLISILAPILPNLLLDEERDGEVIVYTGFREDPSGTLVEVADPA